MIANMIARIKKAIAHYRFLSRAQSELEQAAYEATTPERYGAGLHDIRRFVAYRFRRVCKGHDLNDEILALSCDVNRMYINTDNKGAARIRSMERITVEQEGQ